MLDGGLADAVVDHRDHVHAAQRHPQPLGTAPRRCQPVEPGQLVRADSLKRMPEGQGFPGFHLGDDQRVAVERDNVDLTLRAAPVPLHDPHAVGLQEIRREVLSSPAQHILSSHASSVGRYWYQAQGASALCGKLPDVPWQRGYKSTE